MVGCGFVRVAKPVECHFVKLGQLSLALSASADETLQRELSADTYFSSLARFRCRYSICQVVQRALSLLHHKMH